jgi:hypothetical protein
LNDIFCLRLVTIADSYPDRFNRCLQSFMNSKMFRNAAESVANGGDSSIPVGF